jgi:hypothetical protein
MSFSSEEITLSDICDAYGVSRDMGSLRDKAYYKASLVSPFLLNRSIVPATGEFGMGLFRGAIHEQSRTTLGLSYPNSKIGIYHYGNITISGAVTIGNITRRFIYEDNKYKLKGLSIDFSITKSPPALTEIDSQFIDIEFKPHRVHIYPTFPIGKDSFTYDNETLNIEPINGQIQLSIRIFAGIRYSIDRYLYVRVDGTYDITILRGDVII